MSKLLTEKELCEQMNVSRTLIYKSRKEGMPFVKIGTRGIRYNYDEVKKWFDDKK